MKCNENVTLKKVYRVNNQTKSKYKALLVTTVNLLFWRLSPEGTVCNKCASRKELNVSDKRTEQRKQFKRFRADAWKQQELTMQLARGTCKRLEVADKPRTWKEVKEKEDDRGKVEFQCA